MPKARNIWIDNIKLLACVLVALGHFFQSMRTAGIYPQSDFLLWFNQTIYYFHVPLFFICSGYLYQQFSRVSSLNSWFKNLLKKAVALGIPYFVFTAATYIMKTVFSGSVNDRVEDSLLESLFINPIAPYWFLYALFLMFAITPTFKNRGVALVGLLVAVALKRLAELNVGADIYAVSTVLQNEIWFVGGMALAMVDFERFYRKRLCIYLGTAGIVLFLGLSVSVYLFNMSFTGISPILGVVACASIIMIIAYIFKSGKQPKSLEWLCKYTMPIFLMHTIFAAALRAVLLRLGIEGAVIHTVAGLLASFGLPVLAAVIAEKLHPLDFVFYPNKYIKLKKIERKKELCLKN